MVGGCGRDDRLEIIPLTSLHLNMNVVVVVIYVHREIVLQQIQWFRSVLVDGLPRASYQSQ